MTMLRTLSGRTSLVKLPRHVVRDLLRLRLQLMRVWVVGIVALTLTCVTLGIQPRWHVVVALSQQARGALAHFSPQIAHGALGALLEPTVYPYIVLTIEILIILGF